MQEVSLWFNFETDDIEKLAISQVIVLSPSFTV